MSISTSEHLPSLEVREGFSWRRFLIDSILAILGGLLITDIIYTFQLYPRIPNVSFAYLLIVLALASTRGLYPAILTSFVSFLSFDFLLVPPLYTFTIKRFEEWLALFVFLAIAIITSQLAAALRRRADEASRRERETSILYQLIRATNREEDLQQQLYVIARAVVDVFSSWGVRDCAILLPDDQGKLVLQADALKPVDRVQLSSDEKATAAWVMAQGQAAEVYDVALSPQESIGYAPRAIIWSTLAAHPVRRYRQMIPLKTNQRVVGVLRLSIEDDPRRFSPEKNLGGDQEHSNPRTAFFWTFLDQATSVIERARLHRESLQVEVLRRTDALRAALLSSVSHDLRTPLSSIKAAASSLLQEDVQWDEEARRSFALTIEHEADRLNRLVGNLLDMSRIEGGALKPEKDWYSIGELIRDVLEHMHPLLDGREVRINLPDNLPLVEFDYLEIDQVVTNLVENAVRYTPPKSPIEISVELKDEQLLVSVTDRGPGIPPADLERVFDKFYRVLSTSHKRGSGLGLAVCRGLVEAHGGRIWAENREGGGAIFRFTLPAKNKERAS